MTMNDSVHLVVMTDGRDYLDETIPRALSMFHGTHISHMTIHDDSGDLEVWNRLRKWQDYGFSFVHPLQRLGFAGSYAHMWKYFARNDGPEWILSFEDDFLVNRPIDLSAILSTLSNRPHLAQMSLKRQAWNHEEQAAGGIVELHPDDFTECVSGDLRNVWTEHRRYWTTNPSVFRRSLCARGWPETPNSEGVFTHQLLEDPDLRFGVWGAKYDSPLVEHIGHERVGCGY